MIRPVRIISALPLFLSCLMILGCNETFEPWQENDQYHFSIFGYLDASADTQWVRVMPVREDLFAEPKPIDAVVTLEHVESGESVVMNDSLFTFFQGYAWNFWTTLSLEPEQSYRIIAERSDGQISQAIVELPPDFPTPTVQRNPSAPGGIPPRDIIFVEGVERMIDVQTLHHIRFRHTDEESLVPFIHLQDTTRTVSGDYIISIDPREDRDMLQSMFNLETIEILDQQIYIVSAGPGFHYFPSIDDKVVALPEGVSNVTQGIGYVAGVVSKTIPYESCFKEESIDLIPCELQPPPW